MQYDARARLQAVEVLLTDPETLGNDALETDLDHRRSHTRWLTKAIDNQRLRPRLVTFRSI